MREKDYYSILGVSRDADVGSIRKAFRELALRLHPDKNGGDDSQFKEVQEAYDVLKDESKREEYDRKLRGQTGMDVAEDLFQHVLSSMFGRSATFGMNPPRSPQRFTSKRGKLRPMVGELHLTLEEMCQGASKRIRVRKKVFNQQLRAHVYIEQELNVKVAAGTGPGEKIVLPSMGNEQYGYDTSDVILVVREAPSSHFVRVKEGSLDVKTNVQIPLHTAMFGGQVVVFSPAGEELNVSIQPIHSSADTVRVEGHGMLMHGRKGDLIISFELIFPSDYSALLEKLKALTEPPPHQPEEEREATSKRKEKQHSWLRNPCKFLKSML